MALDEAAFRRQFAESELVEWKEGLSGKRIQDAIVAFSNAQGGIVQIGIRNDGTILGRGLDPNTEATLHGIVGGVRNPGRYSLHELVVGQKAVAVLSIEQRREGFAQLPNGQVLIRKGKTNVGLFGQELVDFITSHALTRFETTPLDISIRDADSGLVIRLAAACGWTNKDEWRDRLIEYGFAASVPGGGGLKLTVAGALFLLPDASLALGKVHMEIFRYPERGSEIYDKRTEIAGPLDLQVTKATQAIVDELGVDQIVLGTLRHELPRLPLVVIREAISNAVAHRSYENNKVAIRISLYPDAVVIRSPGGFPEPVTESNIRDTNAARNPAIIRTLRCMGLAEDAGLGVDRMQDEMRAEMLEPPRFVGLDSSVEVTLPIVGTVAPREKAWIREVERRGQILFLDRVALVHAARGEVLTNARVREILSVDNIEARQILQRLRDAGFLRQTGTRGGSQYFLAEGLRPPAGLRLTPTELKQLVIDLADSGAITNTSIRESTGLSREEVKQLLRELVEEEKLVLVGAGRGARYVLPGSDDLHQLPLDVDA